MLKNCVFSGIIGLLDESANLKFTKSKNFEKPDYVNEAMETLKFMKEIPYDLF